MWHCMIIQFYTAVSMYVIIANTQKPQFYNLVESDSWEVVVGVGGGDSVWSICDRNQHTRSYYAMTFLWIHFISLGNY